MACAPVGGDSGRIFLADLKASEIESRIVETRAGTRTCVTAIDQSRKEATELVQESERLRKTEIAGLKREFLRVLPGSKMAIFSGSLAPGVHANFYADCCAAARRNSVNVILDARGNEMLRALEQRPLVVKPNRSELAATLGRSLDSAAGLRRAMLGLCDMGAQWVIVTLGRAGAWVCDGKTFWEIPGLKIDAVSAIGSGDAFAAGLSREISHGREVPEACRLATACATANALVPGSGIFLMKDVQRLQRRVKLKRI